MSLKPNEFRAACRGCHGGCVHILTVEDGRVTAVRPDPESPLSHGKACAKGLSIMEQMYHPDRLRHPLRRIGPRGSGQWERISWDEALDEIAGKLTALKEAHGPECIATITGTGRHLVPYLKRFGYAIGTPNVASAGAIICLGPRKNAGYSTSGVFACVDYYGEVKPQCLVVWGADPSVSGADGEMKWHCKECVQQGTKLIVIDPQKTELAEQAELWLRLRPGTDGALAMGILNIIIQEQLYDREFVEQWCYGFEELKDRCAQYDLERVAAITWLPKEQILQAARMMAAVKPMSLEWGCAFEQGFNAMQTCRAIYMIPALTGNYDVPGGFIEGQQLVSLRVEPSEPMKGLINDYPYRNLRKCANPHQVMDAIKMHRPYKIRAMLAFANNCLLSLPDSKRVYDSLLELDYFVCADFFMTPTAELADIVLPAAMWPELDCVFYMPEFSEQVLLCQQKLVQVGECRPDEDVFIELCRRMGADYGAASQQELLDMELAAVGRRFPELEGMDLARMKQLGYYRPEHQYYHYKRRGGFPTSTGKFELWSTEVEQLGGDPLPQWVEPPVTPVSRPELKRQFPYILTTGGRRDPYFISNNRQIRSLRRQYPFPLVRMHPDTAAKNGIAEGDWVYIRTFRGRITQKAKLEADMDPRVVNCDFGWWYPEAGAPDYGWAESNANVLTSCDDGCDEYLGSYQLRGLLCDIYKNNDCRIEERYYRSPLFAPAERDESGVSIVIDNSRCVLCGECVSVCRNTQGVGALELTTEQGLTRLRAVGGRLADSGCVGCGQCAAVCPSGGIRVKSDSEQLMAAIRDPDCFVAVQVAPAVRAGLSGQAGFPEGENAMGRLCTLLRQLGADRVFDTVLGADLTVVEEAEELLARQSAGGRLPLLTSCCPAWVSYAEGQLPEWRDHISTCRSPQQMLGAVIRRWYQQTRPGGDRRLVLVSLMPCTAKKAEIRRPESYTGGVQDVDLSITSRELLALLAQQGLDAATAAASEADAPFAQGSGGGTLFGASGGVTEAVLRYALPRLGRTEGELRQERGADGVLRLTAGGLTAAVVSGLDAARRLLDRVKAGEEEAALIEVMACPGGCVMGGGQPADFYRAVRDRAGRPEVLRRTDALSDIRASQDNPALKRLWAELIHGHEEELLHRHRGE